MSGWVDTVLNAVCHRSGDHVDVLPLCLRCSSVYAGALLGLLLEVGLLGLGLRTRRFVLRVAAVGMLVTGVVGLIRLCELFPLPEPVAVGTALVFGWALAALAVASISCELGMHPRREPAPVVVHGTFWLLLAAFTLAVAADWMPALLTLGALAGPGLAASFVAVNFAAGLILWRRLPGLRPRVAVACASALIVLAGEFILFHLWRLA